MAWYLRWQNVFRSERLNHELDDEFQYHLAETVDRLIAEGMPPEQALRQAVLRLGNYSIQKERTRDMNVAAWLDGTRADLLYGFRQLRLNPGFAAIAVLSLALGIGANTAIFELVNAIRLTMLPVRNPEQLVSIKFDKGSRRSGSWSTRSAEFTYAQWEQIRTEQQAFSDVLAWSATRFNLVNGGEPRFAEGLYVSGGFFRALGVNAILGRTFLDQDDSLSCTAGAVISDSFWHQEFGGDPNLLDRKVNLDGHSFSVIGVTPPSFFGVEVGNRFDVAVPLCADRLMAEDKKGRIADPTGWWLSIIGRLRPGWTAQSSTAYLRTLSPRIMRATLPPSYRPDVAKGFLANKLVSIETATGVSGLRSEYERPLWLLMATAGLVLLIACANLANLLLARASSRETEIAVRLAVGASRGKLVRQLLMESLLLAVAGAVLGACLAVALSRALIAFISTADNPLFVALALDWRVLGFTGALAVLTCLLFGLTPALRAAYLSPASAMRAGGRSMTAGRERFSLRRALVATQVALSLVLLVGALLFARSLHNLMTTDSGFKPGGLLTLNLDFSKAQYPKERRLSIYREVSDRLAALPGVLSVAQVGFTPVSGSGWDQNVGPDGTPGAGGKQAFFNRASPGYFRTMETPLLAGRDFNDRDTVSAPKVAIVNEMFARRFFGGANPVGRTFHLDAGAGKQEPSFQIVGLVKNTKYYELREEFKPLGFFPVAQDEDPGPGAIYVIRTTGTSSGVTNEAKAALAGISPLIGVQTKAFSAQLEESLLRERLMATLSEGFGLLAGLLATLGLYGVIAYMVERRRNEIGIRMALGADRNRVIRLVLREAVLLLALGLTAGVVISIFAGRAAATLLFGLKPYDPFSLIAATLLLSAIALIASYVPAKRAAALAPVTALKVE